MKCVSGRYYLTTVANCNCFDYHSLIMSGDTSGGECVVELDHVGVRFETLQAVRDVSFSLKPGNLLGLIGPNGAGKTTLLRAIAGIHASTEGVVRVLGEDIRTPERETLRHVGFTPDSPGVYERLTVRDFLRFIGLGYDLSVQEADERIDFWLDKVWLSEKANQKIKTLSRGMRQRVGLARTLITNPALILLDEPAAGLDPAGRVQFRELLCDLREQGKALIVSSHILADMEEYCTHIGIMSQGAMMRFATVAQLADETAASGSCRYLMTVARAVPRLLETLEAVPGISRVEVSRERVTFDYARNPELVAELLSTLVKQGLPIFAFAPQSVGLEEAYLRFGIRQVD